MKKIFNIQLFATIKELTDLNDNYQNDKSNKIIYALGGNDYVTTFQYYPGYYCHNNVTVYGGTGKDTIEGNGGKNLKFYGETGDDTLGADLSSKVTMIGGEGVDTLRAFRSQKMYLSGDAGNDVMEGTSVKNLTLSGGAGNDLILSYGSQNVSIVGGAGKDSIYFGAGGYDYYRSKNIIVSAGIGNDYIQNYGNNDNATIIGGRGNDSINVSQDAKNNLFKYELSDGNDTIFGFDSNDTLEITSGKFSTLKSGTDFIVKVGKQKIVLKDAVKDKYSKIHIKNSSGKVSVYNDWKTFKGTSQSDIFDNYSNKVKLSLGNGDDIITNFGDNVKISGGKGNKIISSYGNKTTIIGGAGADDLNNYYGNNVKISGGAGNDNIRTYDGDKVSVSGGAGDDYILAQYETISEKTTTIVGGKGNDTIELPGSDFTKYTVQYNTGDGKDTIEGFNENCTLIIDGKVKTNFYTEKNRYGDFTLKVGKGSIFFKGGVAKLAESSSSSDSDLFEENNFVTSDNLSEITEDYLVPSALEKISETNFENLTNENNFVTFTEK